MNKFHLLLGTLTASIVTMLVVAILNPGVMDVPIPHLHRSAPEQLSLSDILDDEILDSPFVRYTSKTHGYSLQYPSTWDLDDSHTEFNGDILSDAAERVVITISETKDENVHTREGIAAIFKSIEEALRFDSGFALNEFERLVWKHRYTAFTDGISRVGNHTWRIREYHVARPKHDGILNISITMQAESEHLYEQQIERILQTLEVCPKNKLLDFNL